MYFYDTILILNLCSLYSVQCTLYSVHSCVMYNDMYSAYVHCTSMFSICGVLLNSECTESVHCVHEYILYTVHYTVHSVHYTLYTIHHTVLMYIAYSIHWIQCTTYTVHRTMYVAWRIMCASYTYCVRHTVYDIRYVDHSTRFTSYVNHM